MDLIGMDIVRWIKNNEQICSNYYHEKVTLEKVKREINKQRGVNDRYYTSFETRP